MAMMVMQHQDTRRKRGNGFEGFSLVEFMVAMERYKREAHRQFPAWHEVLRVLKSLGYRKVNEGEPAASAAGCEQRSAGEAASSRED